MAKRHAQRTSTRTSTPKASAEISPMLDLRMMATAAEAIIGRSRISNVSGITFNGRRDLYEIFGYNREIQPIQYRARYRRNAIAHRVVECLPIDTWRGGFELVEDQNLDKETKFEKSWTALDKRLKISTKMKQGDILSRIGRYAVLVVGAPGAMETPLERCTPENLKYIRVYAEEDAQIKEYETDRSNPRFGQPTFYELKMSNPNARSASKVATLNERCHHSRVQHIAEGMLEDTVFGTPALECIWNLLDDLEKITGGGSEAYFQRADQGMHVDIDPSLNPGTGELQAMADSVERYRHGMERVLRTRGAKINMLGSDVADIKGPQSGVIEQISAGTGIPTRVLTGSEQGKLAAEQDSVKYYRMIEGRRSEHADQLIVRGFVDWMIRLGVLPKPTKNAGEYEVRWLDIETKDDDERAEMASKWATLNDHGEVVVTGDEIREHCLGLEPLDDVDPEAAGRSRSGGNTPPPAPDDDDRQPPVVVNAKGGADWKKVHQAADRFRPRLKKAAVKAFKDGLVVLNVDALKAALTDRNEAKVYELVSGAIVTTSNTLLPALEEVLTKVVAQSGKAAAQVLNKATSKTLRAADVGFRFDATNPKTLEWIRRHAAETVTGVSETTREAIRELVEAAFEEQFDVDDLTEQIVELVNDPERADVIARTETMLASNQGQLEAWDQATDEGLLVGDEKKEWIVTPDDRLCPICEPLDGQQVEMGSNFKTELGDVDAPPAHPRCRCTIGLVAGEATPRFSTEGGQIKAVLKASQEQSETLGRGLADLASAIRSAPAPVVNVDVKSPVVNMKPPAVNVAAPVVNVTLPQPSTKRILRDKRNMITGVEEVPSGS